jgi:hypothetical protein
VYLLLSTHLGLRAGREGAASWPSAGLLGGLRRKKKTPANKIFRHVLLHLVVVSPPRQLVKLVLSVVLCGFIP